MSFDLLTLEHQSDEELLQFDNRVSGLSPFIAGQAYFDLRNYNYTNGEFHVQVKWDEQLNHKLAYKLPAGGYSVNVGIGEAYWLHYFNRVVMVYMKLISKAGRIYPFRTYILINGSPFELEFRGGTLIPVDEEAANMIKPQINIGSQQAILYGITGSNRGYLYSITGSQRGFLYSITGSQRNHWYEYEYESGGSQRRFWKNMQGSQQAILYGITGSNRGYLHSVTGSQRSFPHRYHMMGSEQGFQWEMVYGINTSQYTIPWSNGVEDIPYWNYIPEEWQLIKEVQRPKEDIGGNGRFGYGLDLI